MCTSRNWAALRWQLSHSAAGSFHITMPCCAVLCCAVLCCAVQVHTGVGGWGARNTFDHNFCDLKDGERARVRYGATERPAVHVLQLG